jgi:hypothetical protein
MRKNGRTLKGSRYTMKKGEKSLGKQAMVLPVGLAVGALSAGSGLLTAAVAATATAPAASAATTLNAPVVGVASTPDDGGYWMVGSDGGVFSFGDAAFYGSMAGKTLNGPIVGITSTPDGKGYWLVGSDGGVYSFGDAGFYGSMGGQTLNKPVSGMARTPDGKGYWLVGMDGGVYSFGDAKFEKSLPALGVTPNAPIKGIASTPDGGGYWLVGSDGGVFSFGDAAFYGSMGGQHLNKPVVGISSTQDGKGYWLVGQDGGIFAFGDAGFYGSMAGLTLDGPVVGMAPDYKTGGYWEASADAGIFSFNAPFEGSMGGSPYPIPNPTTPGQYLNPLRGATGIVSQRIDQGVDYDAAGGSPFYAIGDGRVVNVYNSGWPNGVFIEYQLTDGPAQGEFVYAAEDLAPDVSVGQTVTSSTVLGTFEAGADGGYDIETGWGDGGAIGESLAVGTGEWNNTLQYSTALGLNMSQLLVSLGAPGGILEGTVQGSLPAGWPTW